MPAPPNTLEAQLKAAVRAHPHRGLAAFSPQSGQKKELQRVRGCDLIPLMVDYKEIRVKMMPGAHHVLLQCCEAQGYSSISEFVKRAIQEKISTECYHLIMTVEEIETEGKKETKKP